MKPKEVLARGEVVPIKSVDGDSKAMRRNHRYAIDMASLKLIKESGRRATMRLFEMIENEAEWAELSARDKLAIIETAMSRAYGRVETESAELKIEAGESDAPTAALPTYLRSLAGKLDLPELRGAKAATSVEKEGESE